MRSFYKHVLHTLQYLRCMPTFFLRFNEHWDVVELQDLVEPLPYSNLILGPNLLNLSYVAELPTAD